MSFDPAFGMGHRSHFTWPGPLDPTSDSMLSHDLGGLSGSESCATPESIPRSLTSSPSKLSFTPDQREYKKRSRRDSKLSQRMQRSDSNPYLGSPSLVPDMHSAMGLPIYSTPPPLSLLAEPATSMPTHSYLSYSPPMPDLVNGHVFPTGYSQAMQPTYNMAMDYPTAYAPSDYRLVVSRLDRIHRFPC